MKTQYVIGELIRCRVCVSTMKRKEKSGIAYSACKANEKRKGTCDTKQVSESQIDAVLLKVVNTLKEKLKYILRPLIDQTKRLKDNESKNNLALAGIKQQILDLNEQNHALDRLRIKSLIDSAFLYTTDKRDTDRN